MADLQPFPVVSVIAGVGNSFNEDPAVAIDKWVHPLAWWGANSQMRYISGKMATDPVGFNGAVTWAEGPISGDGLDATLKITVLATALGDGIGIEFLTTDPVTDGSPSGYYVFIGRTTDGNYRIFFGRYDTGSDVPLDEDTVIALAANDQIGLRWDGENGVVSAYHYTQGVWQEVVSVADTTHTGPFYITYSAFDDVAATSVIRVTDASAGASWILEDLEEGPVDPQDPPHFPIPDEDITETPESWSIDASIPDEPNYFDGYKKGRLTKIAPITRGLSDETGNYVASKTRVDLSDKDRLAMRTRMGIESDSWVWNREGTIFLSSEQNRRDRGLPRILFRGITQDVEMSTGFNASLSFEDKIVTQFGRFGPDQTFSRRLFPPGMAPGPPRQLIDFPVQYIFGEVSDRGAINPATGEDAAKGMVPVWHIGWRTFNGILYDEYHIAGHAIIAWELYGSDDGVNSEDGETVQRVWQNLPALVAAGDVIAPLYAGWPLSVPYLDILNKLEWGGDGKVHRLTHFFVRHDHPLSMHHKQGLVRMAANVCGLEDVGDGTGSLIVDLYKQYQWIFEHIILPDEEWTTGLYFQNPPQWSDEIYQIHSESFFAAQELSARRIGGTGYRGDFVFCGPSENPIPLRDVLRRFSLSGDCGFTWSGAGQLKCVAFDHTVAVEDKPIWREPEMIRAWPSPRFAHEEVENPIIYSYDWDADAKQFRKGSLKKFDWMAIRKFRKEQPSRATIELRCIRDPVTAEDVITRRLHRLKYPPAYYPVKTPIDGVDYEPGDIVRIQSQEGLGPRIVGQKRIETALQLREASYDPKTKTCGFVGLGVQGLLVEAIELAPDGFPTIMLLKADGDPEIARLA